MMKRAAAVLLIALLAGGCAGGGEVLDDVLGFGVPDEEDEATVAAVEGPAAPAAAVPAFLPPPPDQGVPMPGPRPSLAGVSDWAGAVSAAVLDVTIVARDERGWLILWQLVGAEPPGPLPADAMALGVFLGSRPTGGYAVRLEEPVVAGERIIARWEETSPAPGAFVTEALTAPYAVTLATTSPLPVDFDRRP